MKNKHSWGNLLRRVCAPLLLVGLIAWVATPAYPGNAATGDSSHATPKQAGRATPAIAASTNNAGLLEINDRIKELEAREQKRYEMELEGQRKQIDWWLTFLGVLAAIVAFFGAFIPYLMGRKDKEIIEQDKAQIKLLLAEAAGDVEKIHRHEAEAASRNERMKKFQEKGDAAPEALKDAKEVIKDKSSSPLMRLRAEAISASQAKDADKAYALWHALIALAPSDASAQFNAGYWSHEIGKSTQGAEKLHWLRLAGKHYAQAYSLKPDKYETACNWGVALADEANALATTEPDAARALRKQAVEKYQLALSLKPDMHWAVNNWGAALADEAKALAATEPDAARALWKQAGEKYQQARSLKPDYHDAANNWGGALLCEANAIAASDPGYSKQLLDQAEQLLLAHADAIPEKVSYNLACVYGRRADVKGCLKWLRVSHEHKTLPDCAHLRDDKDLAAVRESPEFVAWLAAVCDDLNVQGST